MPCSSHNVAVVVLLTYNPENVAQQFPRQGPWLDQGVVLPTNSHRVVVDAPAVLLSHPLWVLGGCSTESWQMRGAGNGPWSDLPTIMCQPSFLELWTRSEVREYQFRSTIPLLLAFIHLLPFRGSHRRCSSYIWITTSNEQANYPHYCASFLGFQAEGERLAVLL